MNQPAANVPAPGAPGAMTAAPAVAPPTPAPAPAAAPPAPTPAPAAAPPAAVQGTTTPGGGGTPVPPSTVDVPPSTTDWMSTLTGEQKGYIETKGFKDPNAIVDSYINLEKLVGVKDKLIQIPDSAEDPAWADIHKRLGKPEAAEGYTMPLPEGGDVNLNTWAKGVFHEANLTDKQAQTVYSRWNEQQAQVFEQQQQVIAAKNDTDTAGLKTEWGAAYDKNINIASKAAQGFGLAPEIIDAIEKSTGYAGVMKFMYNVGTSMSEDSYTTGDTKGPMGALSPAAAKSKIGQLKKDPAWSKKYTSGDVDAKSEMDRLQQWAYPST